MNEFVNRGKCESARTPRNVKPSLIAGAFNIAYWSWHVSQRRRRFNIRDTNRCAVLRSYAWLHFAGKNVDR